MGDDFGEGNEEEGSDSNASEESDESGESDDDEGEGGDELPIEKKARKLKKKQAKDAKIAEEELQLNFAEREVFQLPSGQEVDQVRFFKSILGPILQGLSVFNFLFVEEKERAKESCDSFRNIPNILEIMKSNKLSNCFF